MTTFKSFGAVLTVTFLCLGGMSESAHAGILASAGSAVSYSLDTAGRTYEADVPVTLRGGYRFNMADLFGEVSIYSTKTDGTDMVAVGSRDLEFLFWGRKSFLVTRSLALFGAIGFGAHQETVETTYDGSTYKDEGQMQAVYAFGTGLQWKFSKIFEASLEARVSAAESYSPNPRFGVGAFVGIAL